MKTELKHLREPTGFKPMKVEITLETVRDAKLYCQLTNVKRSLVDVCDKSSNFSRGIEVSLDDIETMFPFKVWDELYHKIIDMERK